MRPILTAMQRAVYDTAALVAKRYGKAPTVRRIRLELGVRSLGTVYKHLQALEKKHYIRMDERGIHLYPIEPTDLSKYRQAA
jgi:SOS-response transcriptional repressor LexA